jgi:hypothetical protein
MKVYKLYLAKPLLAFYLFIFIVFPVAGAAGLIVATSGPLGANRPPVWFVVTFLGFALFNSYYWLRIPFEIMVDDTSIRFRSVLRRTSVPAAEVKSVQAKRYSIGLVDIVHARGTILLLNQMDGFHDFVFTLKSLNPSAIIKGV